MVTLIEMVRLTRKNDHQYCGVDANGDVYTGNINAKGEVSWPRLFDCIGKFDLKQCDWKDTLIDVNKILVE